MNELMAVTLASLTLACAAARRSEPLAGPPSSPPGASAACAFKESELDGRSLDDLVSYVMRLRHTGQ